MTAGDVDGNGRGDLIVDFAGYGIWNYSNGSTWSQIQTLDAAHIAAGDIDGNKLGDLVIDFGGGSGIWELLNSATWVPLHPAASNSLSVSDLNGDGKADVVISFGAAGLWRFSNNGGFEQLHPFNPGVVGSGRIHEP